MEVLEYVLECVEIRDGFSQPLSHDLHGLFLVPDVLAPNLDALHASQRVVTYRFPATVSPER
jgi:hypothetical protein